VKEQRITIELGRKRKKEGKNLSTQEEGRKQRGALGQRDRGGKKWMEIKKQKGRENRYSHHDGEKRLSDSEKGRQGGKLSGRTGGGFGGTEGGKGRNPDCIVFYGWKDGG